VTSFSSAGPTVEGFVKPDLVAPGGHMLGLMGFEHQIAIDHPTFHDGPTDVPYFTMSGTSQSAAVVTGAAALLLQAEPALTPDQVKCRLMVTARPAIAADGSSLFNLFRQGAGLINVWDALEVEINDCANTGMDIAADLSGDKHFAGSARQDEDGNYYIEGLDGFIWSDDSLYSEGFIWSDDSLFSEGFIWSDKSFWSEGFIWSDGTVASGGFIWSDSSVFSGGFIWSDSADGSGSAPAVSEETGMSINAWVDQE
jgi:hypothetical protein